MKFWSYNILVHNIDKKIIIMSIKFGFITINIVLVHNSVVDDFFPSVVNNLTEN